MKKDDNRQSKPMSHLYSKNNFKNNHCVSDVCLQNNAVGNSWWWLRSPGDAQFAASHVNYSGFANALGYDVNHSEGGVRPAIKVNLKTIKKLNNIEK